MATKETLKELQRQMKAAGMYSGTIDGLWGEISHGAFLNARRQALRMSRPSTEANGIGPLLFSYCKAAAWSGKVSEEFVWMVHQISDDLQMGTQGADLLMSCMAFETGETFSPSIKNGAGAPYYGLIQFGKAAAKDVGTTVEALVTLSAEQQLIYVHKFFKPYKGKLKTLSDVYMRILWPVAVGKPEDYIIFINDGKSKAYIQNKGLDVNKDGKITKAECALKVQDKLRRGLHPSNLRAC